MTDDQIDDETEGGTDDRIPGLGITGATDFDGVDEDPPIYRSGAVRIIGAEPAGDAVPDDLGPLIHDEFDMPHWNDAPTGQVPAILDRGNGDEPLVAPPSWREEATDWAADEELFEPSMLSDDAPAVGSMVNDNNEQVDMERQPWHFEEMDLPGDEDTLVTTSPLADLVPPYEPSFGSSFDPEPVEATRQHQAVRSLDLEEIPDSGARSVPPTPVGPEASTAAAARLRPPAAPKSQPRAPRVTRRKVDTATAGASSAGTGGRDMRLAVGSGVALGVVALLCFAAGNLAAVCIVGAVVLLAAAEAFAAFRRAQYHPATLLGLVATLSLLVETYNKGVAALPLVLVMLVGATFVWFLANVEPGADPVSGVMSTIFVFSWVAGLGSFAALLLSPHLFPDRHGIAFLLAAIVTTVAGDVASLLVGSAWGRHPMAPLVSPNKTWEGFAGGALASILVAVVVVHFIHPWTIGKALVLGVVVAVVAPLGDLSQSMIKRHLGLKDIGRVLPGHGGILDRVDGLLFVLPATYFVVKAFHLG
jgi:CDP-diglyceride synthetase